ncbi:unnamed protein product [Oppiella nova]|uniref:VWFA domain-containing protein n=1 Tax=Oppiella nova TaxID=334625 RepID=A0A7R9LGQ1_9ACAR|nr:unnamed protein product [Oppiella nova]CAG2163496.1 unnamed protein product [Oppiella nova]
MKPRIVFVLDVSGSMGGAKCETLQLGIQRFIEDQAGGSHVGIVLFDDKTWTEHPIVPVTDSATRQRLKDKVPRMARGGTDIRAGILEGLKALRAANIATEGAILFLATDGGHCTGNRDYVGDVLPHVLQAKVIVKCLAIGTSADQNLERLTTSTGGTVFNLNDVSENSREMMARVISAAMEEVNMSTEMAEVVIVSVYNDIVVLDDSRDTQVINIPIDSDIGRNTSLQVNSQDIDLLEISVISPSGRIFDTTSGQFPKDFALKRAKLLIDTCEPGQWRVQLSKQGKAHKTIRAQVVIQSEPKTNAVIELNVCLRAPDVDCPPLIVCRLHKSDEPVVGALLTATVDKPSGTPTELALNRYHTSGYYYNYFTDYCGSGRYNVSVLATSNGRTTKYKNKIVDEFRRQKVADSFQINTHMPGAPPNDIKFNELVQNNTFGSIHYTNNEAIVIDSDVAPSSIHNHMPSNVQLITEDMSVKRGRLSLEYMKVKKAIRDAKLSELDKTTRINQLADFDDFLTSLKNPTQPELDRYQRRLDDMRKTL